MLDAPTSNPERAILALLPRAAVTSIDRAIIERGIAAGMVPSHLNYVAGGPDDIEWLRYRAACARAERTLYPPDSAMWRYLRTVATSADAEASARERSRQETTQRRNAA